MQRRKFLQTVAGAGLALPPLSFSALNAFAQRTPDVIFVPTAFETVNAMLKLAEVTSKDIVYDLGCGDGRFVVTAAQQFGARGVGIDIDPQRIQEARELAKRTGADNKVRFIEGDLFEADISEATVVTLYLLTRLNIKLRPKLQKELKPGTRIVSHAFDMGDWTPEKTQNVGGSTIYLWRIPGRA
ncbi:MAG: class I SAM-dependent methyltransferase [Betaproteobacteria bacterium]|nr:class I SAM-dependent methyltransferase [Betaproteobacteria bacterium]